MTRNNTIQDPIRFFREGDRGVATIIKASRKIQINDIRVGDILIIRSDGRDDGHVAFISSVQKDENGNVVSYKIIHAEAEWTNRTGEIFGGDVNQTELIVGSGKGYAREKYKHRFYQWDTPDQTTQNQGSSSNENTNNNDSPLSPIMRLFMKWWRPGTAAD